MDLVEIYDRASDIAGQVTSREDQKFILTAAMIVATAINDNEQTIDAEELDAEAIEGLASRDELQELTAEIEEFEELIRGLEENLEEVTERVGDLECELSEKLEEELEGQEDDSEEEHRLEDAEPQEDRDLTNAEPEQQPEQEEVDKEEIPSDTSPDPEEEDEILDLNDKKSEDE